MKKTWMIVLMAAWFAVSTGSAQELAPVSAPPPDAPAAVPLELAPVAEAPAPEVAPVTAPTPAEAMPIEAVAAPAEAAPASATYIALVAAGPVDAALVERVRGFASANLANAGVKVLPAQESVESLGAEIDALAAAKPADAVCVVALVAPAVEDATHGIFRPDLGVAVVNVAALKAIGGDEETTARRIEKNVMQSVGMVLGLEPCPNPQCALWAYNDAEQLDLKGRNFCPPCQERSKKILLEKGVLSAE